MKISDKKVFLTFLFLLIFTQKFLLSSISQKSEVAAGPVAFNSTGLFSSRNVAAYLGASSSASNIGKNSIVKIYVNKTDPTDPDSLELVEFAAEKAWVNFYEINSEGESVGGEDGDLVTNPVYNKAISYLTLASDIPVVVLATDNDLGADQKICHVSSSAHVMTTTQKLNDANGQETAGIVGLSAQGSNVFAAVKPNGGIFGAANSGFSLVVTESGTLVPVNAVTGAQPGNIAADLDLTAGSLVAIGQAALAGTNVNMLASGRLYIVVRTHRSNAANAGGTVSLLIGSIDNSDTDNPYKLVLEPAIGLSASNFIEDNDNYGVGFYHSADGVDVWSSLYNVQTLYTSTKQFYIVLNGGVAEDENVKNKIFALPIVQAGTDSGKIANKNDFTQAVSEASEMTLVTDDAANVGAGDLPTDADQEVQDMFVLGDAVFVCVAGPTGTPNAPEKQGIFMSSAILDHEGKVARWTPWQRVMGSTDKVIGGIIDPFFGDFMYLTLDSTTNATDTIKFTQWNDGVNSGEGDGLLNDLVSVLADEFPQENMGVHQLFNFDYETPTFTQSYVVSLDNRVSVGVATGYEKVVLIENGYGSSDGLTPSTGNFSSSILRSTNGYAPDGASGTKAMAISGGVIDTLGPLCTADISRCALADGTYKGWLFVGGYNGVAVLSDADGNGWDTDNVDGGLKKGFVGITSDMSFKQLSGISGVKKVVCDDTNLYVLTRSKLYRIPLTASNFVAGADLDLDNKVIADADSIIRSGSNGFRDFIASSKVGLLSTSIGLFRAWNGSNIKSDASLSWDEITITYDGVEYSLGSATHLATISAKKGGFDEGGNVYVLANNVSRNSGVHRLYVKDTTSAAIGSDTVKLISEAGSFLEYFSLGGFRSNIHSDGAVFFHQLSKDFGSSNYLKMVKNVVNLTSYATTRGQEIGLSLASNAYNIGIISRNPASGAWMVPGDWGLRVNE
jgi:hypothetical protein